MHRSITPVLDNIRICAIRQQNLDAFNVVASYRVAKWRLFVVVELVNIKFLQWFSPRWCHLVCRQNKALPAVCRRVFVGAQYQI